VASQYLPVGGTGFANRVLPAEELTSKFGVVNVEALFVVGNTTWASCAFVRIHGAFVRVYAHVFEADLQHLDRR
jgi:hypothetical protein